MKNFAKIIYSSRSLNILAENFILDVWKYSEYAFARITLVFMINDVEGPMQPFSSSKVSCRIYLDVTLNDLNSIIDVWLLNTSGTKYSRMDQVKVVQNSL